MKKGFDIQTHVLVSKHAKLDEKGKEKVLEKYNISIKQLPSISKKDPAIQTLNINPGDVIEITRQSPTGADIKFYRVVIND